MDSLLVEMHVKRLSSFFPHSKLKLDPSRVTLANATFKSNSCLAAKNWGMFDVGTGLKVLC